MMLRIFLVLLVCLVATVVEYVFPFLFGHSRARADLLLSVVLYLALNDEVVMGAGLSALAGYLGELGSATPVGLYTFLAVLTWAVVRVTAFVSQLTSCVRTIASRPARSSPPYRIMTRLKLWRRSGASNPADLGFHRSGRQHARRHRSPPPA